MKVLLYTENLKSIGNSGLGKAIKHQKRALEDNNIDYTTNKNEEYDIVHINFYGPKSYFLAKKAKKLGKKIIYHAHSTEEDFKNSFIFSNLLSPLFKKWIIKCYSLGDYIITPTPYSKRILESYGITRPIVAISNGIDMQAFERNEEKGLKFREKFNFDKNDKVIIGVGLYIERKGILDFVELAKRMPEYKFVWMGYSPLAASPKKIKDAVNTKLPNLFFPGYVEFEILQGAYSGANVYIFPTLEENEGIPALEACTSKIDMIVRDIPVFESWLINNKNVYKAKDVNEFEILIKKLINKEIPSLTNEAYQVALDREVKKVGKQLIEVYKKVLNEK
ncbi:MAG: glycosyltransferase [Bacilli bacterium]|nr:glycosyltransferase [Bacilli bacterium]